MTERAIQRVPLDWQVEAQPDANPDSVLRGVREFPARVKCASLCWHTLAAALRAPDPAHLTAVSTETD